MSATKEATKTTESTKPVEKTGAIATVLDPSIYESVGDLAKTDDGQTRSKTPWVGFFGEKTKAGRDALVAAGIEVNQFYLYDNEPLKVKPFAFHLLKARRFYTQVDNDGKVTGVLLTKPNDDQYNIEKYREYIMAQVVVIGKDPMGKLVLTPATWGARSGLAKVFQKAIDFTRPGGSATDVSKWASRSTAHAISANARWPGGRFVVQAWGTVEDTTDGKTEYNLGHSSISPTSAEGVAAFNELASGERLQTILLPANNAWEWRCKSLEKAATKK